MKYKVVRQNAFYVVDKKTGCWNWQGAHDHWGYGRINRKGRTTTTHRYFYEEKHGKISRGLVLDHLCRNPKCCNPKHLEPVTPAENVRREPRHTLTKKTVNVIRKLWATGLISQVKLGRAFDVVPHHISRIINNKKWK